MNQHKRILPTVAIVGAALYLSGCAALGLEPITDSAPEAAPKVVTITRTVTKPSEDTTVRLIEVLDAAGCDFRGVAISEGAARKGSSTLQVQCK